MNSQLFCPLTMGPFSLKHRVVMAPLTRSRAGQPGDVPTAMNAAYYKQRSDAALIITEATQISRQGQGYAWTPGIYTDAQVEGWREVTSDVHAMRGVIFMQLWHVGRVSHPIFQPDGGLPVAPSALPVPGKTFIADEQGHGIWTDIPVPQELTQAGIRHIVEDFRLAARRAIEAGMDGVEIHAGNGYLLDQFINSSSNHRVDQYGGSIGNRARFLIEVVDAVTDEIGCQRVGVRLTPMGRFMGMGDETPEATFGYIVECLNEKNLAYLHLVEPSVVGTVKDENHDPRWDAIMRQLRDIFAGVLIVAGGYDGASAEEAVSAGRADLVAFGRLFIANPDLPKRLRQKLPLNEPDATTFFGGDSRGYIDYPPYS
jgi:N-ethylmaleimide reductase